MQRQPVAWANQYRMGSDKRTRLFLEGNDDILFWKQYVDDESVKIENARGWENVKDAVEQFNGAALGHECIGVIDSDFERIYSHKGNLAPNLFMTDFHDLEMMKCLTEAFGRALGQIDDKHKIKQNEVEEVRGKILEVTDRIGYLKLSSLRNSHNLKLKDMDKDGNLELPKYEKFISGGTYKGDDKMLQYMIAYARSKTQNIPEEGQIIAGFRNEADNPQDSAQLSNGHDFMEVMKIIVWQKYKINKDNLKAEHIQKNMNLAFGIDQLKQTQLYANMMSWAQANGKKIFDNQ